MTAAVFQQLAMAVLWTLVGVICTVTVQMLRRDRAKAAREDTRVAEEFAPTLTRWRSANAASRHLRPSWLPAATRSGRARLRSAASGGWAWLRSTAGSAGGLLARLRPAPTPAPVQAEAPPVWSPADHATRDVNEFTWPTNPTPTPVATGWASVDLPDGLQLDFTEQIHARNAWLHRQVAMRMLDPDATGLIPVQSGAGS